MGSLAASDGLPGARGESCVRSARARSITRDVSNARAEDKLQKFSREVIAKDFRRDGARLHVGHRRADYRPLRYAAASIRRARAGRNAANDLAPNYRAFDRRLRKSTRLSSPRPLIARLLPPGISRELVARNVSG